MGLIVYLMLVLFVVVYLSTNKGDCLASSQLRHSCESVMLASLALQIVGLRSSTHISLMLTAMDPEDRR